MPQTKTPKFTIVALEQGTSEWREWRHKGIGASDAPTIMGENPWKSASDLLREKRGPARDGGQNAAMARGTQLEPEARRRYIVRTGTNFRPACLQSGLHTWLRASVDGISADGGAIVEIKCGESVYRKTSQNRSVPDYTTLYRFLKRLDDKTIQQALGEAARRLGTVGSRRRRARVGVDATGLAQNAMSSYFARRTQHFHTPRLLPGRHWLK